MAGNFWQSSHCQQWLLDKQDILRERGSDIKCLAGNDVKSSGEEEYQKVMIFFTNLIQALGENVKVRQQVIATATVYFKRFYARNSLKSIDPLLMAPTCIFLASKVEEFGLLSMTKLIQGCQTLLKSKYSHAFSIQEYPYKANNVHEAEFFLLEMMDCCLIVYHPYRPLMQFINDLGQSDDQLLTLSWKVINDSLRTDVALMYPPYQITLACVHIASVMLNKDLKQWFAELSVDMEKILEIIKQIMALYQMWKTYDEKGRVKLKNSAVFENAY